MKQDSQARIKEDSQSRRTQRSELTVTPDRRQSSMISTEFSSLDFSEEMKGPLLNELENRGLHISGYMPTTNDSSSVRISEEESVTGSGSFSSEHDRSLVRRRRYVASGSSQRLFNSKTQSFTVNRLKFSTVSMVGREEETKLLEDNFRSHAKLDKSRVVLIDGESGTGKTRLAESLVKTVQASADSIFVRGKFDLLLREKPYAGIISACEDLLDRIVQLETQDPPKYEAIVKNLIGEIDTDELFLLVHMIPFFRLIIGSHLEQFKEGTKKKADNAKSQFNETFRRFIRVISSSYPILVILLDDLQWADISSLNLIEHMLESEEYSIFCIGLFRSNEVDETHILTRHMKHLEDRSNAGKNELTCMTIGNLSEKSVNLYLQDLLGASESELEGLTRICHQKTGGNIFFLISFIAMLNYNEYLEFNFGLMKWRWNEKEIEANTQSTENVAELLLERMKTLENKSSRELLRMAACLGTVCEKSMIKMLWSKLRPTHTRDVDDVLSVAFENLLREGFLQDVRGGKYMWVHDKIRDAALMLIPVAERETFQRQVGVVMAENLRPSELEAAIFVVAQLVNQGGAPTDAKRRVWFAGINLHASQRSTQVAAFTNALQFAAKGISFLPSDKWTSCSALCHELYMNLIPAERLCGDISSMEQHCGELIEAHKDSPIEKRLGAYLNLLSGVFYADPNGRGSEAIEIGFKALRQLGCRFPRTQSAILFRTIMGVLFLKRIRKYFEAQGAMQLRWMKRSQGKVESTKLLYALMDLLYLAKDARFPLVIVRYIEYTFEYGVTVHAPSIFAMACALLTGVMNDLQGGALYAKFALKLMDMVQYRPIVTGTMVMSYSLGLAWTTPVRDVRKQMVTAYDIGLRTGEREYGAIAAFQEINYSLQTGKNLDVLETDCRFYLAQLRKDGVHLAGDYMEFALLVILTLKGEDTEEVLENIENSKMGAPNADSPVNEKDHFFVYWTKKLLSAHMGDFDVCAEASVAYKDIIKQSFPGSPSSMVDPLVRGLSCMVVARRTRKKAVLKEAKRLRAVIKDWVKQGNPNIIHYEAIMDAEFDAIQNKDRQEVLDKYEVAVKYATRGGFTHDAALFNECWGSYALESLGDKGEAKYRFGHAIQLYTDWGACARIEKMRATYIDVLGPGNSSTEPWPGGLLDPNQT